MLSGKRIMPKRLVRMHSKEMRDITYLFKNLLYLSSYYFLNKDAISPKKKISIFLNREAGPGDIVALAGVEATSGTTFTDGKTKIACIKYCIFTLVFSICDIFQSPWFLYISVKREFFMDKNTGIRRVSLGGVYTLNPILPGTSMYVPDPVMSVSVKLGDPNESTRFGKAISRFRREGTIY